MNESRCYGYTRDVKQMSRDAMVVHEMLNEKVEMLWLYTRCSGGSVTNGSMIRGFRLSFQGFSDQSSLSGVSGGSVTNGS